MEYIHLYLIVDCTKIADQENLNKTLIICVIYTFNNFVKMEKQYEEILKDIFAEKEQKEKNIEGGMNICTYKHSLGCMHVRIYIHAIATVCELLPLCVNVLTYIYIHMGTRVESTSGKLIYLYR